MDYALLIERYINKQQRFYNRTLTPFNKFLLKELGTYLAAEEQNPTFKNQKITLDLAVSEAKQGKIQIALITEDVGHLTGGRYYCWFMAAALVAAGYEVTVYTNRVPVFLNSFKQYPQPKIKIVTNRAKDLENLDIKADIYLGSPISGDIAAAKLGHKYQKPSFALIFDPFPMMAKYLGVHSYVGWTPLIKVLAETETKIITLCDTTTEYIYDWLNKRKDQVLPVYPCINSRENDFKLEKSSEPYVLFISRLVAHKNFAHVLKAAKENRIKLKVISSIDGIGAQKMVEKLNMKDQVEFCFNPSDKQKFSLIKQSRVVINGAIFEGFGMWFIEAISNGIPTVCYEYPTIIEIARFARVTNLYLAKWNDPVSLSAQLKLALQEKRFSVPSSLFDFEQMVLKVKDVFRQKVKLGIITICLNEQKFISASLASVIKHPSVVKVAVVEGAVNLFAHAATDSGLSTDKTGQRIYEMMLKKEGGKIIYEKYGWANDKSELRNRALSLLGKDVTHVLVVDGDEVWKKKDLDNLIKAMEENPQTGVFLFSFLHFWKNKDQLAVGGQWDSQLFRAFKFSDKSLHWEHHAAPVVNANHKMLNAYEGQLTLDNVFCYHYGYCKDKQDVQDKLSYYHKRDGKYLNVVDTWTNWKPGQPTQPTHGGGNMKQFQGIHPEEIKGIL